MERRAFLKISAITGATAALDGCGNPERQLIRFIPEEDLVPGVATWKPSLCTLCPAGCGLSVRVMEGEAEVIRNGQVGLLRMSLAKKLEGNPEHPLNHGKLCPRGQAGIQITYHPDRITSPLKRTGPRGSGQFQEIAWEEAIQELVTQLRALLSANESKSLAFVTRPGQSYRAELVGQFMATFGSPLSVTFDLLDDAVLRRANGLSFGNAALPTFDLAHSSYVVSFGADFLGTWNSPVAHSAAYGEMRQGRPGVRAKFVQIESRMSQSGANADEWMPIRPGTEGALALGLAHVLLKEKLRTSDPSGSAAGLIEGWTQGLPAYEPSEVEKKTGVAATALIRLAREMARQEPAVTIIGGPALAHTNALFNAIAVNALNELLGGVGKTGGLSFAPPGPLPAAARARTGDNVPAAYSQMNELLEQILSSQPAPVKVLLVDGANPVFAMPRAVRVREALERVPFIASFQSFIDETSILADLILPDHSPLESWLDHFPESGTTQVVASLAPPVMRPLHNTRAMPDVLLEAAEHLGGTLSQALPWKNFEEMLRSSFIKLREEASAPSSSSDDEFWHKTQKQGGWWSSEAGNFLSRTSPEVTHAPLPSVEPEFDGKEEEFPFHFLPYASQAFLDGSLAHLPWLQELPDALSTGMWGTWVEINPETAERHNIQQGDLVELTSRHGTLRAPALLSPGIALDVLAMPIGQGHTSFGRYAERRGANPVSILAPIQEPETGALAWAATRVRISRVGEGKLVLFAGGLREHPVERR